MKTEQAVCRSA